MFSEFGQLEETYRKSFKDEIVCVDTRDILTAENQAILPFQLQGKTLSLFCYYTNTLIDHVLLFYADIDELPIICTTFTINGTDENIVIVTRGEVEGN